MSEAISHISTLSREEETGVVDEEKLEIINKISSTKNWRYHNTFFLQYIYITHYIFLVFIFLL